MRPKAAVLALVLAAMSTAHSQASPFEGVAALAKRNFPELARSLEFREMASDSAYADAFRIERKDGRVTISASSPSAAAKALGECSRLACRDTAVCGRTRFRYRYALNYCTFNYSYSFHGLKDLEREIDRLALQGVNMMLAPLGVEAIWAAVLPEFGLDEKEVAAFIPGPAYTAWWLMGNLEGWGGPMSRRMRTAETVRQRGMLARMKELGIEPVVQGFNGLVPQCLAARHPEAHILGQGGWCGFERPSLLDAADPLFDEMADRYYDELQRLYGDGFRFVGGDLFHEGGNTEGIELKTAAAGVYSAMERNIPGAIWVLQGWGGNPDGRILDGIPEGRALVLDLFGENGGAWKETGEYGDTPWIWCSVNNFGGRSTLGGQLGRLASGPHEALESSEGYLVGTGIMPEGFDANPAVEDIALRTAWEDGPVDIAACLREYTASRYGKDTPLLREALDALLKSVYVEMKAGTQGPVESIFLARPSLDVTSVSTWGPHDIGYDTSALELALLLMRAAATEYAGVEAYMIDLQDIARQVLANHARGVYSEAVSAYREGDKAGLSALSSRFLGLLRLQDALMATRAATRVGHWLRKARQYGGCSPRDRTLCEMNLKTLITCWGPAEPDTPLRDYANREWSGVLEGYCLPRWEAFFRSLEAELDGSGTEAPDYFAIEQAWLRDRRRYSPRPEGDLLDKVDEVIEAVSGKNFD